MSRRKISIWLFRHVFYTFNSKHNKLELRQYEESGDTQGAVKSLWDLAMRFTKAKRFSDSKQAYLKFIENCRVLDENEEIQRAMVDFQKSLTCRKP
jgi:hypothetical protein